MVESKDSFPIKVRTFDSSQFEISVTSSLLVSELKSIIENTTRMPSTQQRLIYKGKVLKNDDALAAYKIEAGHVLQLVGNQAGSEPPPLEPESERTDPLNDIIRLALEANPAALLNRRRRRYHRRREIDINERLETIRQNLQTIEGMIQSMSSAISINSETSGFELNRRQFSRGQ